VSTLAELTRSRELFWNLTLRELRTRYKRSALGWAWSMLNPLATMLVYTFIFVTLLESNAPVGNPSGLQAYGLYILCAILPWNYMAIGVGTSMGTVIASTSCSPASGDRSSRSSSSSVCCRS
jgi:lipopolysaccharide transport system permease protein